MFNEHWFGITGSAQVLRKTAGAWNVLKTIAQLHSPSVSPSSGAIATITQPAPCQGPAKQDFLVETMPRPRRPLRLVKLRPKFHACGLKQEGGAATQSAQPLAQQRVVLLTTLTEPDT